MCEVRCAILLVRRFRIELELNLAATNALTDDVAAELLDDAAACTPCGENVLELENTWEL